MSPKPSALATWLLEHFILGPNKDAVVGDLLEQFSRRPSNGWYWRQTLAAIGTGIWKERYMLSLAAVSTLIWSLGMLPIFYPRLWRFAEESGWFFSSYPWLPWPLSQTNTVALFSLINGVTLPLVLCMYLAFMKSLEVRRVMRGLLVGLLALPLSVISALAASSAVLQVLQWVPVRGFVAQHTTFTLPLFLMFMRVLNSLPMFVVLLVSMWAARTYHQSTDVPATY